MTKKITIGNFLIFLIFSLVFSLLAVIVANFQRGEQDLLPDSQPQKVDISLKKIILTNTENGEATRKLEAESVDFDARARDGLLRRIHVTFFGGKKGNLFLTANEGEFTGGGQIMKVRGNVIVRSEEGYTFYSDDLLYRQKDDLVSTESPVRVVANGVDLRGRGLRFRLKERSFRILQKVDADFALTGGKQP